MEEMERTMSPRTSKALAALVFIVALATTGCDKIAQFTGHDDRPPPNVKGAPMEPMPTTRQQAQDAVYRYYVKTLQALPDGYALDNSIFGGVGTNVSPCDDVGSENNNNDPAKYHDARVLVAPTGTDYPALVAKVGEIWKSWGWRVEERKGFNKPNFFGTAPDGYMLKIEAASNKNPKADSPNFSGSSPCFTGDKRRYDFVPFPTLITRDGVDYAPSVESAVPDKPSNLYRW